MFSRLRKPVARFILIAAAGSVGAGGNAPLASLAGSEWRPPGTSRFVRFEADGKLTGHGGCNRFFAEYRRDGDLLSIGPLGATRMACEKSVMDAEQHFFEVLQSTASIRATHPELDLRGSDGGLLIRLERADWD